MGRKEGGRAWQQPLHPLGGSTHAGNRGTLAASAASPFSLPIEGSEKQKSLPGRTEREVCAGRGEEIILPKHEEGWVAQTHFLTASPPHTLSNSAGQK